MEALGARAELAASLMLNLPWNNPLYTPMELKKNPQERFCNDKDVGPLWVRATKRQLGGLLIQPSDAPGLYLLAIEATEGAITLAGWLDTCYVDLRPYWRQDLPRPAFLIPQQHLQPFRSP